MKVPRGANPRRTSAGRCWLKPTLVRQDGRREDFVMHLVGEHVRQLQMTNPLGLRLQESAAHFVSYIWPSAGITAYHTAQGTENPVITLGYFIQETLKRSRSTYSTLQVTLFYLYLIKTSGNLPFIGSCAPQKEENLSGRPLECGRRMFLAALILASKYLQDRNYSTKAWSKITSLPVQEINANERAFLSAIGYSLHLPLEKYNYWCGRVQECVETARFGGKCPWAAVIADMSSDRARTSFKLSAATPSSCPFTSATAAAAAGTKPRNRPTLEQTSRPASFTPTAAPPSPTLSRPLTTPSVSPWSMNGVTPAASNTKNNSETASGSYHTSTSSDRLRSAIAQLPTITGINLAPEIAFSASMATSQSTETLELMCMQQEQVTTVSTSFTDQPIRCSGFHNRRMTRGTSSSTTSCYAPSPLRSGIVQLPTPPTSVASMSSVGTAPLDSPSSSSLVQESTDFISTAMSMNLIHRVAQEAHKHGLNAFDNEFTDLTLPPIKIPTAYDSFSDVNSDVCSSMSGQSSPNTDSNLPALAHVLRCGLREHLKPYMQEIHQTSFSPSATCPRPHGLKRGSDNDIECGRLTKVQRASTF